MFNGIWKDTTMNDTTDSPESPWRRARRTIRIWWRSYEWPVVGLLAVVGLVLGFVGMWLYFQDAPVWNRHPWEILFRTIQLLALQFGLFDKPLHWTLQVARLLLPTLAVYTGIRALAALYYGHLQVLRVRFFARHHVVICGLGERGLVLAKRLRGIGSRVVVIEQNPDDSLISACRDEEAVVFIGDARDKTLLHRARVQHADHLISVCGSDGINAEVAAVAHSQVAKRQRGILNCVVDVQDHALCSLMREWEIAGAKNPHYRLELTNMYDQGARAMLREHPPFGVGDAAAQHLLVIGVGRMGESLLAEVGRKWWVLHRDTKDQLPVTLVDLHAEARTKLLCLKYPRMTQALNLTPAEVDVSSPEFRHLGIFEKPTESGRVSAVYVCLDNDSLGLSTALTLARLLGGRDISIVVRTSYSGGLTALLKVFGHAVCGFECIHPFGLLDRTCAPELVLGGNIEILAQAFHARWLDSMQKAGHTRQTHPSMLPWDDLSDEVRESNRAQAAHIGSKLRAVRCRVAPLTDWDADLFTFTDAEVEFLARAEHERWMVEKMGNKWTYAPGPIDPARKTHPCLVDWERLPDEEKNKDRASVRSTPAFLAEVGLQVYRTRRPA